MASGPPEKRFWMKVDRRGPDECWPWTAKSVSKRGGHGMFRVFPDLLVRADKYAYELLAEPIPPEMTIRHRCEDGLCVNPAHLTLITLAENSRIPSARLRAWHERLRTAEFCNSGLHEFTPENTGRDSKGKRFCKECRNANSRARWTGRPTCKYGHPYPDAQTEPGKRRACETCRSQKPPRLCTVEGCGKRYRANGYCNKHMVRMRERGTPSDPKPLPSEAERFWARVDKHGPVPDRRPSLGRCWTWTGSGWTGGFQAKSGAVTPRAWAWIDANGPVPAGHQMVLSACGTRRCVNPGHSFTGTRWDLAALVTARRERCVRGHSLAIYGVRRKGMRGRFCKECHRIRAREWRRKNPVANAIRHRTWYLRQLGGSEPSYPAILMGDPCSYCGAPCEHIDHIVPLSRGGSGEWDNLTAACTSCNTSKGARSLLVFMLSRAV